MIDSILTRTIDTGLQRPEQTAVDPPVVKNDTQMVEDSLEKVSIQYVEQKANNQPTVNDNTQIVVSLEKLSSDDKVPSTNLPKNIIKIPVPSTESTPVAQISDLCVVFTKKKRNG